MTDKPRLPAFLSPAVEPQPAEPKPRRHAGGMPAKLRECPDCGGWLKVAAGQRFPEHNQHIVTPTGIREGDTPCDGHRHIAGRAHRNTHPTSKEN